MIFTATNALAIILTKSTGGVISLIVALFCMLWLMRKQIGSKSFLKFVLGMGGVFICFYLLNAGMVNRKIMSMFNPESGYVRVISIIQGIEVFRNHWVTGIGLGNSPYFIITQQIHNAYLSQAVETGILGILGFLIFNIYIIRRLYHITNKSSSNEKYMSIILLSTIIFFLIQWLSFYSINIPTPWVVYSLSFVLFKLFKKNETKLGLRL
ncbi:O-antigen ligase family protein [Reichenbachiella carrageenanivorans]|uniref:O-antigen ligase family protein n=1 Tax=Reichenbachiella carrageenanivorans TaxID=2979869 RepID=A0ABY6D4P6_9BACT|nr:O-antigen ligase family protein [Reichenbachiella carrageenanivorans]UXX80595.1 O-antigen ligase family protein [Reichenbachiella carrageenanivorans]